MVTLTVPGMERDAPKEGRSEMPPARHRVRRYARTIKDLVRGSINEVFITFVVVFSSVLSSCGPKSFTRTENLRIWEIRVCSRASVMFSRGCVHGGITNGPASLATKNGR